MQIITVEETPFNNFNSTTNPEHIDKKHWEEWQTSGVSEKIISQNVLSVTDPRVLDKILDRNTKRKWKHSYGLVPCWQVSGIDPFTEERTLLGVQVKPDIPVVDTNGKVQKYIGASGYGTCPLFLDTGEEGFWKSIIDDKTKAVIITEGAKKAGAGLSIGYPTISIPGVSTCKKKGRLHAWVSLLAGFGRTFYLCFDNDAIQKRQVQEALLALGRELCATGSKVMVIVLPFGDLKGMDDYIATRGSEEFTTLVENAKTIEEWKDYLEERRAEQDVEDEKKSRIATYYELVKAGWGHGLRLNKLKQQIELHGQPLDIDQVRLRIALEFNTDVPIGDSQAIVEMIAKENSYSPILEYLENLEEQYPDINTSILDNLAELYFGSKDPLHNSYMKKTLLAAIARVKQPGCKHDHVIILVGRQGTYKSTFWQVLFGDDWFTDELGDAKENDEIMKLHQFWGLEWSEFEAVYKRKDVAALKKFISSRIDTFRAPYARKHKEHPRACILVGTTNETEILSDPTGNRRFWIVPVQGKIPISELRKERDEIWAAANALYETGEMWRPTEEEETLTEVLNREYQSRDPWEKPISEYVKGREYVTTEAILESLGIDTSKQDMASAKRVTAVLRRMSYQQTRKRVDGHQMRVWIPDPELEKKLGQIGVTPVTPVTVTQNLSVTPSEISQNCSQETQIIENTHQEASHPPELIQQAIQPTNLESVTGVTPKNTNFFSSNDPMITSDSSSKENEKDENSMHGKNEHSISSTDFEIGQMVKVIRGPQAGNKLEILGVGFERLKLKFGEKEISIAIADTIPLPPTLPEPELFVLGTGNQRKRKVDLQSLVGKKVGLSALGGEEHLVVSIDWKNRLICQSLSANRKAVVELKDIL